jgi:hypothetical protein
MNKEKINSLTKRLLDVTLSDCLVMSTFEVFTNMKNYVLKNLSEYEMEELKAQISFFNEEERSIEISLIYRHNYLDVSMRTMLVDYLANVLSLSRNLIIPSIEEWSKVLFDIYLMYFRDSKKIIKVSDLIEKRKKLNEMKKTIKLTESQLIKLINNKINEQKTGNYMFFSNLKQMRRQIDMLLSIDPQMIEETLQNGHDWADDHIATATENMDQVFDFLMNEKEGDHTVGPLDEETKREPTNKTLWSRAKSLAKSKYKVWPSAYASGWAAKWYKKQGGSWKNK